jgi:hypothetical protein
VTTSPTRAQCFCYSLLLKRRAVVAKVVERQRLAFEDAYCRAVFPSVARELKTLQASVDERCDAMKPGARSVREVSFTRYTFVVHVEY